MTIRNLIVTARAQPGPAVRCRNRNRGWGTHPFRPNSIRRANRCQRIRFLMAENFDDNDNEMIVVTGSLKRYGLGK